MVSSHSGNSRSWLNRIASILHSSGGQLKAYEVIVVEVDYDKEQPQVHSADRGPLTWLALLGFLMTVFLITYSCIEGDGMSLLAALSLSLVSTLVGVGRKWSLQLPVRRAERPVPRSDVIINYPHGAFIIVKCAEETQRQLYWHPESCRYLVGEQTYRLLALMSTLLLMVGVVFLGNAKIQLQVAWAGSYVVLNAAYWIVAALPARLSWDLSAFRATPLHYAGGGLAEDHPSFTQALWHAIAITRSSAWARDFDIAPKSRGWDEWLQEAANVADDWGERIGKDGTLQLPEWNAPERLSEILAREYERQETEKRV